MNDPPRMRRGGVAFNPAFNPGCGYLAMENRRRAQWQSALGLRNPPRLTDLRNLAALLRVRQPESSEAQ
jgi:hypothetical protein